MSSNPSASQTLLPPPLHPSRTNSGISPGPSRSVSPAPPLPFRGPSFSPTPELPPRPPAVVSSSEPAFSPTANQDDDERDDPEFTTDATQLDQDAPHEPFEFVQTSDIPGDFLFKSIAEDMPEAQLRELYENEEIERFVNFFSAVSMVTAVNVWVSGSDANE